MRTTLIFSDIHLTTAEPPDPKRPLWKRFKQADRFVDDRIARMLADARASIDGELEVILNGDIFDFDAVTDLPPDRRFPTTWLERHRSLAPTEAKSVFKMERILADHPVFVATLRELLQEGHHVIFVVGNHDLELHWLAVQQVVRNRLGLDDDADDRVRFCEWFYVSEGDTLVEHGNQYDAYCLCADPFWPTIRLSETGEERIRLPFGSYAARVITNGMGLINPHSTSNWVMPFWGYVLFFWNDVLAVQPFLPFTWMWSACVTLWLSLRDGFEPAERDVLRLEERVDGIAERANTSARTVRGLHALRVHPAFLTPWSIARELWLDRLTLFALVVLGSFQILATAKVFVVISFWWWLALLGLLFPPFLFYARNQRPDVDNFDRAVSRRIEMIAAVAGVNRVVFGHTHLERHTELAGVEVINPGTWSPAYRDLACTVPDGRTCVVWLRPTAGGQRVATCEAWLDPGWEPLPATPTPPRPRLPIPVPLLPFRRPTVAVAPKV